MSNKIVPGIYRAVIDEVISAIKPEFDEFGVGEDVLAELQHKWQQKVMQSHVAEFETPPPPPPPPAHHAYPSHPMHMMPQHPHYPPHNAYGHPPHHQGQPSQQPQVKSEPMDNRYMLSGPGSLPAYTIPTLAGPQLNGAPRPPQHAAMYPPQPQGPQGTAPKPTYSAAPPQNGQQQRIPQTDGPSSSSSDSPSPPAYAPRSSHPSLPAPPGTSQSTTVADDEAINSDLDDSDTGDEDDADEGGAGDTDIVFCTYDKVARVKTKWKCVLKDGIVHVNGKDYLFAKCTGEFEW
ncbi:hypothetical protein JAAARDRAFT_37194 [Jaapia argillacea MUCL 33604]|uniref:Transcription factor IIA, alpha/beta subunit n=1 Tax=Jaapia argillacea MUCL 33604 TaxID=933084 RepID=A0A067PWW6_9AGAM|nr:hypothetical protein JAAARDRAFT_37194 [Jaapia argillacea MUCL 33604]